MAHVRYRWRDLRLQHKLVLSLALITALVTGGALATVRSRVHDQIDRQIDDQVQISLAAFRNFQARSEALASSTAALVAAVPSLEAALSTGDARTVQGPVADIQAMLAPNTLLAVADRAPQVMAVWPAPAAAGSGADNAGLGRAQVAELLRASVGSGRRQDWWSGDGRLYEVFLHPIYRGSPQPENIEGWVALGGAVDRTMAEEIRKLAAGQVVISYGGEPVVSSLGAADEQAFARQGMARQMGLRHQVRLGQDTYAVDTASLGGAGAPTLTVLRSNRPAEAFLSELNRWLLLVGLAALLIGAGLAYLIAGTFTRPLSALVAGARALAAGDYRYPLRSAGAGEAGELTAAFARMRDSLEQSQERLLRAARMEAVGQLAGGVAHDFNNLITVINGFSDLMLQKTPAEDPHHRYLQQIRGAGERAAAVTRQLLVFSRKDDAKVELVDLNAVLAGLHKMLAMLVGEAIELVLHAGSGLARIECDPTHIEQVVMNLAANARDAMPRGGTLTISTESVTLAGAGAPDFPQAAAGRYVLLSAGDTGVGMDAETQRRIFEPFFTTKEVGRGTGLGLATVYGIVQRCGGQIQVASALGAGTCFRVLWPAGARAEADEGAAAAASAVADGGGASVLLVEDEAGLRAMARAALEEAGYRVLEAGNGLEALTLARGLGSQPDLVLSDVVMPKMGGVEMAAELRRQFPKVRVVFMSGHTEATLVATDASAVGAEFLLKPFAPQAMLAKIAAVLAAAG